MTDLFDRAQQLEQRQREQALARQRSRSAQAGHSLSHCEDCAEPIPLRRQQIVAGCRRCIACQTEAERHA